MYKWYLNVVTSSLSAQRLITLCVPLRLTHIQRALTRIFQGFMPIFIINVYNVCILRLVAVSDLLVILVDVEGGYHQNGNCKDHAVCHNIRKVVLTMVWLTKLMIDSCDHWLIWFMICVVTSMRITVCSVHWWGHLYQLYLWLLSRRQ